MNDITHPELVAALVKPPKDIIESLTEHTADLWHGATGVAGEAGELLEGLSLTNPFSSADKLESVKRNAIEESGDLYFYIEQLVQRTGIELDWDEANHIARSIELTPIRSIHILTLLRSTALAFSTLSKKQRSTTRNWILFCSGIS